MERVLKVGMPVQKKNQFFKHEVYIMDQFKKKCSSFKEDLFSPAHSRWILWIGVGLFLQWVLLFYFFLQREFTSLCFFSTLSSSAVVILSAREGYDYFIKELKDKKEIESEKKLWEARFQTVKERMQEEKELLQGESEKWAKDIREKEEYIGSLKRLAATLQFRVNAEPKLIDNGKEVEELKNRLQEMQIKLEGQEDVKQKRRERNETLLATTGKGAIVLKDLAKGLK
jgi:hypothetical protein